MRGFTVQVLAQAEVDTPDEFSGAESSLAGWDDPEFPPVVVAEVKDVPVFPASAEDVPRLDAQDRSRTALEAVFPGGTVIGTSNRVRVVDGPFAGVWAVDGDPAAFVHPLMPWSLVVAVLDRI